MNVSTLLRMSRNSMEGAKSRVRYRSMMSKMPSMSPKPDPVTIEDEPQRPGASSKAMQIYLERVRKYNAFMTEERTAFEIGRRHLANMMGQDPETFTQADIDSAIAYLFPSSLYEPLARPLMKPPEEIFPPRKEAEFDESGRPYHFLFYTAKPRFFEILHNAVKIIKELNEYEDKIIQGIERNSPYIPVCLDATTWITKEALESICCERLSENEYEQLKLTVERIASHPYGSKNVDFVSKYCLKLEEKQASFESEPPEVLEDGRQRVSFHNIRRRNVLVDVSVTYPGSGKFLVDNKDIRYFGTFQSRECVLFPLVLSNMVKKVDVEAKVLRIAELGAPTALALAIRVCIARGLYHFVDNFTKEKMKLAGLLNHEIRQKERKKPGQEGARRKFTWRKR